jgi:hygromycin-B 7''-O-kinase
MMPDSENPFLVLESYATYSAHFMDLGLWEPHARRVCQRHNLQPCDPIRPGLTGTYPTFIVANRWVIKFFGQLFGGAAAFQVERQANQLVAQQPELLAPAILASGHLLEENLSWRWPYLILEFIPGVSIGEVYDQIGFGDKLALARQLGEITRQLPSLKLEDFPFSRGQGWQPYLEFLEGQRSICVSNHREWNSLPENLIAQIEGFLLPSREIVDLSLPPALIHADITRDHLLGQIQNGHWQTQALIDFGDAMIGDIFYELAALHLDTFQYDRRLLKTFLAAYGLSNFQKQNFARKALSVALLHQFNVFFGLRSGLDKIPDTLEALALQLWG